MSRHIVARVASASAITALLLGLMATPAAAASHTNRWVDDDQTAGDGPTQCDTAAYSSIQAAIDDSSAGDWVYVCPGTYIEQLRIQAGVHVTARPLHAATLAAPTNGTGNVVELQGDHATVRGLRIHMLAVAAAPTIRTPVACTEYATAVLVLGNNDGVRDNLISAVGSGTLTGPCGYDYGIVVGTHGDSATARVTFNWVTDFKYGGILVEDTDSHAYVRRNTVRFFHENDCPVVALIICSVTLRPTAKPSVNNAFVLTFGIGVESDATADIIKNWVGSGRDACTTGSCSVSSTPTLSDGISMTGLDSSETTTVRDNVVTRTTAGIVTRVAADGAVIRDNTVSNSHYGYWAQGDNDEWHDNHTSSNDYGMDVAGSDNNIHDNDFRGNSSLDCKDETSGGSGTAGTHNTWTNDLGNSDSPDGLCIPDAT